MVWQIHTETSSLRTIKIMPRNLSEIARSWNRLLGMQWARVVYLIISEPPGIPELVVFLRLYTEIKLKICSRIVRNSWRRIRTIFMFLCTWVVLYYALSSSVFPPWWWQRFKPGTWIPCSRELCYTSSWQKEQRWSRITFTRWQSKNHCVYKNICERNMLQFFLGLPFSLVLSRGAPGASESRHRETYCQK
jgi:hypothetical protein